MVADNRVGAFVRARRRSMGLTQAELAERMGDQADTNYVTKVETGRVKVPQQPFLGQLARALRVSEVDLLRAAGVITEPSAPGRGIAESAPRYDPDDPQVRLLGVIADLPDDYIEEVIDLAESVKRTWERRSRSIEAAHVTTDAISASSFYDGHPSGLR